MGKCANIHSCLSDIREGGREGGGEGGREGGREEGGEASKRVFLMRSTVHLSAPPSVRSSWWPAHCGGREGGREGGGVRGKVRKGDKGGEVFPVDP